MSRVEKLNKTVVIGMNMLNISKNVLRNMDKISSTKLLKTHSTAPLSCWSDLISWNHLNKYVSVQEYTNMMVF